MENLKMINLDTEAKHKFVENKNHYSSTYKITYEINKENK